MRGSFVFLILVFSVVTARADFQAPSAFERTEDGDSFEDSLEKGSEGAEEGQFRFVELSHYKGFCGEKEKVCSSHSNQCEKACQKTSHSEICGCRFFLNPTGDLQCGCGYFIQLPPGK